MSWKADRYRDLSRLVRRSWVKEEIDEEMQHHLAMRYADNLAQGMSDEAAWQDALRRFGDITRISKQTLSIDRQAEREERRMEVIGTLWRDARQATRSAFRSPGFSLITVLTLSLGLAGTTAIFALLDSVILNPLAYRDATRLVYVSSGVPKLSTGRDWGVSAAGYFHFLNDNRTFTKVGAYTTGTVNVTTAGLPERVRSASVTSSLLETLGVTPAAGRVFLPDESGPKPAAAVILSHAFWRSHFGADRSVVNRTVKIDGNPFTVVGVMAAGVELPDAVVDVWLPLELDPNAPAVNSHYLSVVGRMKHDVTLDAVQSDLARLTGDFTHLFPSAYSPAFMTESGFSTHVVPLRDHVIGDVGRTLWMLLAAVAIVLAIACANVANLFLVRTEHRERELAIRNALGAGRMHLALHYIAESLLLCMTAAALAIIIARAGLHLLLALQPTNIPRLQEVHLGSHAVVFALVCAFAAAIVYGSFPVLNRRHQTETLRDSSRGQTPSRLRRTVRAALVVAQVALSLVLMTGAGLMMRTFNALRAVDPGISSDGVMTAEISIPWNAFDSGETKTGFYRNLTSALASTPGVKTVSISNFVPLRGDESCASVFFAEPIAEASGTPPCEFVATTGPGTFESLGMRIEGRDLTWQDISSNSGAVLVSRAFASRFWPGQSAIGKEIRGNGNAQPYYHIVGVVENVHAGRVDEPELEGVFYPLRTIPGADVWGGSGAVTLIVKTSLSHPAALVPEMRRMLASLNPNLSLANARPLDAIVSSSMQRTSFIMLLLAIAAAMSLALSAVGLYGVMSYIVNQRRSEIGLRIALGARASQVRGLVLGESLRLVVAGVVIGLVVSLGATTTLQSMLFGVHATDVITLTAVSLVLVIVSAAAAWIPAGRASRVQPMQLLN